MSVSSVHLAAVLICAAVADMIHRARKEARREARAQRIESRLDALTSVVLLTRAGPPLGPGQRMTPGGGTGGGDRRPVVSDEEGR